jgi:hypothetical protein
MPNGKVLALVPLAGWEQVASRAPTVPDALAFIVTAYGEMPLSMKHDLLHDMFGVAFSSEVWMLRPAGGEKFTPEQEREVAAHEIKDDPDRVEARLIYFAAADGPGAALLHERDGVAEMHDEDGADAFSMDGTLPELLTRLVRALL